MTQVTHDWDYILLWGELNVHIDIAVALLLAALNSISVKTENVLGHVSPLPQSLVHLKPGIHTGGIHLWSHVLAYGSRRICIRGHPQLRNKFETTVSYLRPCLSEEEWETWRDSSAVTSAAPSGPWLSLPVCHWAVFNHLYLQVQGIHCFWPLWAHTHTHISK